MESPQTRSQVRTHETPESTRHPARARHEYRRPSAPAPHARARQAPSRRVLAAFAMLLALVLPAVAEDQPAARSGYSETVTVTATRLEDKPEPTADVPASVTVITREQIAASGARTIQELLARVTGAILFDETGNAVQMQFDLRGFTGNGITVLLDGARINDPRNNHVAIETIGLGGIQRIGTNA